MILSVCGSLRVFLSNLPDKGAYCPTSSRKAFSPGTISADSSARNRGAIHLRQQQAAAHSPRRRHPIEDSITKSAPTGEPSMQAAAIPTPSPTQAPEAIIRAEKIEKYYAQPSQNRIQVISATDLEIVPGEIVALLGPSGSGKSTMLRMLSGLSVPSAGQVYWHEKPIAGAEINVSIVFQSFALFPWPTVLENVEAPLQA